MQLTVVCTADWSHVDVLVHAVTEDHIAICGPAGAASHVDILGLCYHEGLCGCQWSVLPPRPCWCLWLWWYLRPKLWQKAVLMIIVYTATRDGAEVQGTCWRPRECECWWSVLPLTGKGKEATFAIVSMIVDSQLKMTDNRKFLWQPLHQPNLTPPPKK